MSEKLRIKRTPVFFLFYNGNQIAADLDENGDIIRTYTWGSGIDNLLAMTVHGTTETNTYYVLKDHQNSVLAFTDSSGTIVETYEYDAWGNVTVFDSSGAEINTSNIGNRYLFQGREYDSETGLYYFRARWYSPETGRWLSKDPIGISGGLNLYAFCSNNPVNFVDPFGLCEDGWNPDWGEVGDGLRGIFKGILEIKGGKAVIALGIFFGADGPLIETAGAGLVVVGIGDTMLGYAHVLGGLTGTDTSDVPDSFLDMVGDGLTGSDEVGDVLDDIKDGVLDVIDGMSQ